MKQLFLFLLFFLFLANVSLAAGEGTYGSGAYGNFPYGLAQSAEYADQEQEIIGENITEVVVSINSPIEEVIVNESISEDKDVNISLANLINESGEVELVNNFTLTRQTTTVEYIAEIPAGTMISGGSEWDGKINIPTVKNAASYSAPSGTADIVIDMGSGTEINFSKAVKIVIGGQAGKNAAWSRGTSTLTEITTVCDNVNNPTNINTVSPRECYIDSSSGDLLIYSYHFTQFAAYTPTSTSASGGSSTGGSRGSTPPIVVSDLEEETPTEPEIPETIPESELEVIRIPQPEAETTTEEETQGLFGITGAAIRNVFSGGAGSVITPLAIVAVLVIASVLIFNPIQRRRLMRMFRRRRDL